MFTVSDTQIELPSRLPIHYYGGKWNIAKWIISHFPKHTNYVEPCGGAASVLLRKKPSVIETYNDLEKSIVNFFRVLRNQPDDLINLIELTPWSRYEFTESLTPSGSELEQARQFYIMSWMSMAGNPNSGWRRLVDGRLSAATLTYALDASHLKRVAKRLKNVQLENSDALYVIKNYDTDDTLIYFDPPYVESTRTSINQYAIDWAGDDLHVQSAKLLHKVKGFVVISGYNCELYNQLYKGWTRYTKETTMNGGAASTESLWLSPRTVEALGRPQQVNWIDEYATISET